MSIQDKPSQPFLNSHSPVIYRQLMYRLAMSLVVVAAITVLCYRVLAVNATTAGFAFLVGILGIATAWGFAEAVLASIAAMLCFNFFFFSPVGHLTIADPENWVALFAFLVTALVASHLSHRARKQAVEARARQRETEQLYALGRAILLTEPTREIGCQAAQHIARIYQCRAVALYDARTREIFNGGPEDLLKIKDKLKQVVIQGVNLQRAESDLIVSAVTLGGDPIGSLALKGISVSDGAFRALLNLVAIALERIRAEETASRAEAARQSDEFKSTLLDAIAHEFKTPLTSIKAASTSILSGSPSLSAQTRELTTIIDEEADRLSLLVTEAVRMSQIDSGKIQLDKHPLILKELLQNVLEHFGPRVEGRTQLSVSDKLPAVSADPELISLALRQLIDNSLKYSPPASPVVIIADTSAEQISIRVCDRGPGIPEMEHERVFNKFYRRDGVKNRVPGTGLGLYIAREIIRAHGGDLWVESGPDSGSEFCATIPAQEESRKT